MTENCSTLSEHRIALYGIAIGDFSGLHFATPKLPIRYLYLDVSVCSKCIEKNTSIGSQLSKTKIHVSARTITFPDQVEADGLSLSVNTFQITIFLDQCSRKSKQHSVPSESMN